MDRGYSFIPVGFNMMASANCGKRQVVYAIDQNTDMHLDTLKVVAKEDNLSEVDAIIVSIGVAFEDAKSELERRIDCPIISLQNLVYEIALSE